MKIADRISEKSIEVILGAIASLIAVLLGFKAKEISTWLTSKDYQISELWIIISIIVLLFGLILILVFWETVCKLLNQFFYETPKWFIKTHSGCHAKEFDEFKEKEFNHFKEDVSKKFDEMSKKFDELQKMVLDSEIFRNIGGHLLYLREVNAVQVVHFHRDEDNKCEADKKTDSIPHDERGFVRLSENYADFFKKEYKLSCACTFVWPYKLIRKTDGTDEKISKKKGEIIAETKKILARTKDSCLIFLGSTKSPTSLGIEELLKEKYRLNYCFDVDRILKCDGQHNCSRADFDNYCAKVKHYESREKGINEVYGLITRAKLGNNYIIMAGGSHMEGQAAITGWFEKSDQIYRITREHEDKPLQILLKGQYISGSKSEDNIVIKDIDMVDVRILESL